MIGTEVALWLATLHVVGGGVLGVAAGLLMCRLLRRPWRLSTGTVDALLGVAMVIVVAGLELSVGTVSGSPLTPRSVTWFWISSVGAVVARHLVGRSRGSKTRNAGDWQEVQRDSPYEGRPRSTREGIRKPTERRELRVEFLGEQDGRSERDLKAALTIELTQFAAIERAYLARVGFSPGEPPQVVLCLAPPTKNQRDIVERVAKVFADQFSREVHLDIMFPTEEQETDLRRVCSLFYERVADVK